MEEFVEGIHKARLKDLPTYNILDAEEVALIKKNSHASHFMPRQEKGTKNSCALPYELYADGMLSADKKSFGIKFKAGDNLFGDKSAGSPFNVYAPGKYTSLANPRQMEAVRTWAYAVTPGDTVTDQWPLNEFENSHYHLRVYGPNGFYREFKGDAAAPLLQIAFAYQAIDKRPNGNITLTFSLPGNHKTLTVEVTDNAYKTGSHQMNVFYESFAPQTIKLDLTKSHGWYDFSVKVKGYTTFEARYAGRVESGKHSISDPLMGGVL